MRTFITRHAEKITGMIQGLDRVLFRGNLLRLCYAEGVQAFLRGQGVLLKEFGEFVELTTGLVRDAGIALTERFRRPIQYLNSSTVSKEEAALEILRQQPIQEGFIGLLTCVEPCSTWQVFRSKEHQTQELRRRIEKCLHQYFYYLDPDFGLVHVRVQTWIPYTVQVCVNGREWLSRQLDHDGIQYRKDDNCFPWIADVARAQATMDRMFEIRWPSVLTQFAIEANPMLRTIAEQAQGSYHWTAHQMEYATDVMFRDPAALAALYPKLARFAITQLNSRDTMRFLGRKLSPRFEGEVVTRFKVRQEGICVRHHVDRNSIKAYDKFASILRIETETRDPGVFRRRRKAQGNPDSAVKLRPIRRGVVDLKARAKVSAEANSRYLEALATVDDSKSLSQVLEAVLQRSTLGIRKIRALAPWSHPDIDLLRAVAAGEFLIAGFRNRDIRTRLFPNLGDDPLALRKASAKVTRLLTILRAHGVIERLPARHLYRVTPNGRLILTAVLAANDAAVSKLVNCA